MLSRLEYCLYSLIFIEFLLKKCDLYILCFHLIDFKSPCVNQGLLNCFILELVAFYKGACLLTISFTLFIHALVIS